MAGKASRYSIAADGRDGAAHDGVTAAAGSQGGATQDRAGFYRAAKCAGSDRPRRKSEGTIARGLAEKSTWIVMRTSRRSVVLSLTQKTSSLRKDAPTMGY